jgi:receptor-binding and translocation channel-forming TcA subunit of Tc toxin/ABC toxin-like protein/neuraminidase-like protein
MLPIVAPINPGNTGQSVANLQAALLLLFERGVFKAYDSPNRPTADDLKSLAEKLRAEQSNLVFGEATRQLLLYFQVQQGLGDQLRGVVEEATAKRLNELLGKHGVVFEPDGFVVRGKVTDTQGQPRPGLKVVAFDRDLRRHQRLKDGPTDAEGFYEIRYRIEDFRRAEGAQSLAADLFVVVLPDDDLEPLATSEVRYQAKPIETIDLVVDALGKRPAEFERIGELVLPLLVGQGKPRDVLHVVADPIPTDLFPHELNADDIEFIVRETGLDAAAVQDWAVAARLWHDAQKLQPQDASPADRNALQAHGWPFFFGWRRAGLATGLVGALSAEPDQWATSLRVAQARGWISSVSENEANALLGTLERLSAVASLDPVYAGDPLFAAVGAQQTGLPPGVAVKALKLYRAKGLEGLADFAALAGADPTLGRGLAKLAMTLRVCDLADGNTGLIQPIMQRLDGAATGLAPLAGLGIGEWTKLALDGGLGEDSAQGKAVVLRLKVEQQHPAEALQARVMNGDVEFEGYDPVELGAILESNIKSVDTVLRGGTLDAADTFAKEHAGIAIQFRDLGRWVKAGAGFAVGSELIKLGFTPGVLTNYGETVIDIILPRLPPAIRDVIAGAQGRFRRDILTLLGEGMEPFRPPVGLPPGQPPIPQIDLPPPIPTVPGISAPTVRGMFGDLDDCVCAPCESVLGQGAYLVDLLNLLKREVLVRGTTGAGFQTGIDLLRARRPDILDLELSCENAEVLLPHVDLALEALEWRVASVQLEYGGPAARPVADWFTPALDANLLALLQRTCSAPLGAVQSVVDARSPRLWRVTDGLRTWLIEALPLTGSPGQAQAFRLISLSIRRTEASSDPRIEPAHRNPTAYSTLGAAIFPWNLPYDLAAAESRQYQERLKLPQLLLLERSAASTSYLNEVIGLTTVERGLLAPRPGDALWQAWGFANAASLPVFVDPESAEQLANQTPQQLLQRASILLARSGLGLAELESVLATRFVGAYALTQREQCKTSLMRAVPAIAPDAIDRLHRFVRLWRKLPGWSIELLDSALAALNPVPAPITFAMDADVLAGIAAVQQARSLLGLPTEALLGLRAPLSAVMLGANNSQGSVSLFADVFLSNRVSTVARALFARVASPGAAVTSKLGDNLDALAAALGAKAPELSHAVSILPSVLGDAISHDTLTWLYRCTTLSRALGVSVLDLLVLGELHGLEPLVPAVPPDRASSADRAAGFVALRAFAEAAAKIYESLLSIPLLADILLPENHALRRAMQRLAAIKTADQITSELKVLRKEMREAEPMAEPGADGRAQQVRAVLSQFMESDTARQVVDVFADPQAAADPALVAALSGPSIVAQDPFGMGLLTAAQANDLLSTPLSQSPLADRLAQTLSAVGGLTRRLVLLRMLGSWTGLADDALTRILQDGLKISSAAGGDALSMLTHRDFWSRDDTTPIDEAIITWAKRLDRLVAILKGMDSALALKMLPGRNWEAVIMPTGATGVSPWRTLEPILDLRWLAQPLQISEAVLRAHVEALAAPGAAANLSSAIAPLARRLDMEPAEVLALTEHTVGAAANVVSLRDPRFLRRVTELAALARPLRATAGQLAALVGTDTAQVARTARQLLAARAGAEGWNATLTTISDTLRKQQRDALVAYLLQTTPGLADANSLYEQLLIDPQIQPCFMTTRITQAVASVQLLVQRMLFGLEPEAFVSAALRERWSWMRSYRLWEANRKVFLYPENWLFPELRDDKSPAFRRLESTLGQSELSQERAGQAFGQFLDDINQVGQTEVLGLFEDVDALRIAAGQPRTRRDLVMVGRSPNPPYLYHWRRCRDFGKRWMEWSPWERIELDIQGDHVMPFVANGRFHVAWPIIQRKEDPNATVPKAWQVELAWSAFDGMAWRQVSSSRDNAPPIPRVAFEDERSGLAFRSYIPAGSSHPTVCAYVKDAAANTSFDIPTPDPIADTVFSATSHLLSQAGEDELVDLLVGQIPIFKVSAPDYYDVMEFYCAKTLLPPMQPVRSEYPSDSAYQAALIAYPGALAAYALGIAGYVLISIRDVFTNPGKLAWHRTVRGDDIARPIIDRIRYTKPIVKDFIATYRLFNPINDLVNAILANCSSRTLHYEAWVRLSSNSNDLLKLEPGDGTFNLEITGESPRSFARSPGQSSEPMIKIDAAAGGGNNKVELKWTPTGKPSTLVLPSEKLDLDSVAKGHSVIQTLNFEIKDLADSSGFRTKLATQRYFRQVQKFTLQLTGAMETQAGNGSSLGTLDTSSDVWMNGFQELGTSNQSFGLNLRNSGNVSIPVFAASGSNDHYWLVGASAPGASIATRTNLWHFRERAAKCFIDVSPEPATDASGAGISIYPSAWPMGDTLSKAWQETGQLPSGYAQIDEFGANRLPRLVTAMQVQLPGAVLGGYWSFDNRLPNACYNWEVYFHAPLLIADQLSKQQRFEDAERWLRMVFDPNSVEPGQPQAFLRFRVFRGLPRGQSVANDLKSLAKSVGGASTPFVQSVNALISRWRSQPYRPFVIARRRHVAFLWRTVFAYLDNLLAWADSLYRRDTREAIGEAAQLYILAARILGPKPRMSRARRAQAASSYTDLALKWDEFANAWFDATTPAVSQPPINGVPAANQTPAPEGFLFFCIPINEKLNTYWDLVNERLFNIRHCRNLEGITRDLPLTDPPIDPELLVRAAAAGLDMNDVVNDLFARPLPYRYSVLATRALDLAGDVRAFGGALLSALEKRDGEQLAQLRSMNELDLLKRVTAVRTLQIEEAERNLEALRVSRAGTAARYEQIQRQLGMADKRAPGEQETIGEESQLGRLASGSTLATSNWGLIVEEQRQLDEQSTAGFWTDADSVARVVGGAFSLSAAIAHAIPGGDGAGKALSALASAGSATADAFRAISQIHQTVASRQATSAGHIRRRDEWAYQANQVLRELRQMDKQILANEIRIALTRAELRNHEAQIEQAEAIDTYLRDKFTNAELYDWMSAQLSNLQSVTYRMAIDMARRAERAAARELGVPAFNIIRSDYSSSRRFSLLAGDRLHQDIKRLEIAYLEQNRREYEITKHISLRRLAPEALLNLRVTRVIQEEDGRKVNQCQFDIPEWLFDLDTPGHYLRRIKSVSVSIPSVVGPFTSVNCKLTLLKSQVRHDSAHLNYPRLVSGDHPSFTDYFGASEAIVTSTGSGDSGLFETQLRDERFLPFEGAGVISRWRLELPGEYPQFDYSTISDVFLTIRYTARDGGDSLRDAATGSIETLLTTPQQPDNEQLRFTVVLSCRSDFPTEWVRARDNSPLEIQIPKNFLPYWMDVAGFVVQEMRVADLYKVSSTSTIELRWLRSPQGDTNTWTVSELTEQGYWEADLGSVGSNNVTDRIVLLKVGPA